MTDWTDIDPTNLPHPNADSENITETHQEEFFSDVPTEPSMGREKVFKQKYPLGKPVDVTGTWERERMNFRNLTATKDVEILSSHGITAVGSEILEIVHPSDQSVVESISKQEAFIVTPDLKMIDVAAYAWPIDCEKAIDVRATINNKVRYGDKIMVVGGAYEDVSILQDGETSPVVPTQDLKPLMAQKES